MSEIINKCPEINLAIGSLQERLANEGFAATVSTEFRIHRIDEDNPNTLLATLKQPLLEQADLEILKANPERLEAFCVAANHLFRRNTTFLDAKTLELSAELLRTAFQRSNARVLLPVHERPDIYGRFDVPIWSITRRGRAPYSLADDRPLLENSKKRIRSAFLVWTPDQINSTGSDFEPPYVLVTTPAFPNGRTRRKELRMNDDGQLIEYHPSEADTYRIEEEFGATINDMFN